MTATRMWRPAQRTHVACGGRRSTRALWSQSREAARVGPCATPAAWPWGVPPLAASTRLTKDVPQAMSRVATRWILRICLVGQSGPGGGAAHGAAPGGPGLGKVWAIWAGPERKHRLLCEIFAAVGGYLAGRGGRPWRCGVHRHPRLYHWLYTRDTGGGQPEKPGRIAPIGVKPTMGSSCRPAAAARCEQEHVCCTCAGGWWRALSSAAERTRRSASRGTAAGQRRRESRAQRRGAARCRAA